MSHAPRTLCLLSLLFALSSSASAQQKFPYDAVVIGDKVEVRSGPGTRYYATSLVNRNDPVKVRRHDHGGWYMIEPPRGSFSLIEASQVKRIGADRGIVQPTTDTGAAVKVRIGSTIGNDHSIYARELSQGDEVLVLGEQVVQSETGAVSMLKIAPPSQEFRWIKGEFIAPVSQQVKEVASADPYQIPVEHRERLLAQGLLPAKFEAEPVTKGSEIKVAMEEKPSAPAIPAGPVISLSSAYDQLTQLDRRYRDMIALPPEQWQLESIAAEYTQLRNNGNSTIAALVDQRMEGLAQRMKLAGHFRTIAQTIAETSERDAQLAAQQSSLQLAQQPGSTNQAMNIATPDPYAVSGATAPRLAMSVPGQVFNGPTPLAAPGAGSPLAAPVATHSPAGPAMGIPAAGPDVAIQGDNVTPKFNGAGVVTQVSGGTPGMPAYALISPSGKFLTFLEPATPQVDLKPWIGREAGMIGQRKFNQNLGSDVITVQRMQSVKLTK